MPDNARVRRVSLQERTLPVGNVVGINGYKVNRATLRRQIEEEGYEVFETRHFFVVLRPTFPSVVLVHWFAPQELDASIGDFLLQELKPLGVLTDSQDYDDAFGAIVGSLAPHEAQQAWHRYTANTFHRFRHLTSNPADLSLETTMSTFATLYRRVYELLIGNTFLDAGCSTGLLPLLVANHFPKLTKVVGTDIRPEPFATALALAEELQLHNVQFIHSNLLGSNFDQLGSFDTVTLLHVLEHFTEQDMYQVLVNLLKVTIQRLILAVPYEKTPENIYGHEQLFAQEKLEEVGRWCLRNGASAMWYEDCADGLLVIEMS